jgi:serine/threonine protein kinase
MNSFFFTSKRVKKWFFQMINALFVIHQKGILHTNFTPKAILIDTGDDAKLGKFGVGLEKLVDMLRMESFCLLTNWFR